MKKYLQLFLCLVLVLFFHFAVYANEAQETTILKFGHALAETNPFHLGGQYFSDLLYEETDGRYKLELYSNGALGFERDLIEGVQMGSIDICATAATPLGPFVPDLMVVDLPFLIKDNDHADKVYLGEIGQEFRELIDSKGFKALTFVEIGFRVMVNNRRPIETVEDVARLKIRTMENDIYLELWRAMGADSLPMAWGEAFTAMQQGAIDALELTNTHITTLGVIEIAKYYAETNHVYTPGLYLMSQRCWNSLSDEDQKIFMECAYKTALYNNEINRKINSDSIQMIKDKGIVMTYPNKEEFIEATQSVYDNHPEYNEMVEKIRSVK